MARARSKAPRRRRPAAERRDLIVTAARAVIADRGFAYTTMRDIAAASDVSLGTLTYHFDGIDEILREALLQERTQFYETAMDAARSEESGLDSLRTWVSRQLKPTPQSRQHWSLWLDFWSLAAHNHEAAEFQSDIYAMGASDLGSMLRRGCDDGSLAINDVDATVVEMMALMDGVAAHAFLPADRVRESQAVAVTLAYVDRLAAG